MTDRVTLREYLEQKIAVVQGAVSAGEQEREHMRDTLLRSATRVELAAVADKVDAIQSELDRLTGRRTLTNSIAYIGGSGLVSLLVGIAVYVLSHRP